MTPFVYAVSFSKPSRYRPTLWGIKTHENFSIVTYKRMIRF